MLFVSAEQIFRFLCSSDTKFLCKNIPFSPFSLRSAPQIQRSRFTFIFFSNLASYISEQIFLNLAVARHPLKARMEANCYCCGTWISASLKDTAFLTLLSAIIHSELWVATELVQNGCWRACAHFCRCIAKVHITAMQWKSIFSTHLFNSPHYDENLHQSRQ